MAFFIDDRKLIESIEDDKIAYLTTANDSFEASLICELLRDSGIPCMAKDRFAGATAKVFTGLSSMGTDVFVARPKLEEAKELFDAYMTGTETDKGKSDFFE
ncbi:MAG: DUF2007 domain-containing protein [Clostridia bacterium]|nr:DUF2007 domain-containing protein [Clostridia bacterium]